MDLDALTDQVLARCQEFAGCSDDPECLTRIFLRPATRKVHALLQGWMLAAHLQVRIDAIGNMIGSLPAKTANAPVFLVGSHLDTVPDAGKYDGVLGVLLGLASVQALGNVPRAIGLDLLAFSEEEGVRYRTPYLGSLAITGKFGPSHLSLSDEEGITLEGAVREFGLDPTAIAEAKYAREHVLGYLEAHIEQGPVLEALDLSLAAVEAIVGQSRRWLSFVGKAGHAGTLPMEFRHDPLSAAAEWIGVTERTALATPGLRATVGSLEVRPGAVNVVPGRVRLSLDVRHAEDAVREKTLIKLLDQAKGIAERRGLALQVEQGADQPAVNCSPDLTEKLTEALRQCGHRPFSMASGAGHDAAVMATLCPMTMLFLRSPGGISHHPDEAVRRQDVRAALEVMICFLQKVLGSP